MKYILTILITVILVGVGFIFLSPPESDNSDILSAAARQQETEEAKSKQIQIEQEIADRKAKKEALHKCLDNVEKAFKDALSWNEAGNASVAMQYSQNVIALKESNIRKCEREFD